MKLNGPEGKRFVANPRADAAGVLLFGPDAMRVTLQRQALLKAMLGPNAEEDMRLARLNASDIKKDPATLDDAIKAQGFFPGPRAVFIPDANDGLAKGLATALDEWRAGDAQIVAVAGSLTAKSALRKLFEGSKSAVAIAIYADPPTRDEIERTIRAAGLSAIDPAALEDLSVLGRTLEPGDFTQTVEKLALYKMGDDTPLTSEEVADLAPQTVEAETDSLLHIVAEARHAEIGPMIRRLQGQGVQAVGLCINAARHFQTLHAAAVDPKGASAGLARCRPPVFGPRRDRMARQAQTWGARRLEEALSLLQDTDLQLRSAGQTAPQLALVERMMIRIAMMGQRR